ncbi:hypothetical protein GN244_ATG00669 [Phytophthora infestans]|uniref:Uncharacterized protein n=1 Tax=Phytophthora infestans TaxID=4787 RepID=A0A833T4K8_PHYIN|nr:hypothetical protein GN244_ATG00669 [Phytophthora infestans]KAF4136238.1 hypothetical protein GN958_ATG14579 [Phytophthora infestans]KAF4138830.1 hypothetical protein GN958_ATG12039 [Phytophthora infestans]
MVWTRLSRRSRLWRIAIIEVQYENDVAPWGDAARQQTDLQSTIRQLSTFLCFGLQLLDLELTHHASAHGKLKSTKKAAQALERQLT